MCRIIIYDFCFYFCLQKVIGTLDTFYVITYGGVLYRRTGVTSKKRTGTGWEDLGFRGVKDVARTDNKLVVLLMNGTIIYKNGMNFVLFTVRP